MILHVALVAFVLTVILAVLVIGAFWFGDHTPEDNR